MESFRLLLCFLNFSAISCFTLNGKNIKISRRLEIFNALKIPLLICYIFATYLFPFLNEGIFRDELILLAGYSAFSKFMAIFNVFSVLSIFMAISYLNFRRRFLFLHVMIKLSQLLSGLEDQKKYENKIKKILVLFVAIFSIVNISSYLTIMKPTAFAALCFVPICIPYTNVMCFLCFYKIMEASVEHILHDFFIKLRTFLSWQEKKSSDYQNFILKYQEINELVGKFNTSFGSQNTILTLGVSLITTLGVTKL